MDAAMQATRLAVENALASASVQSGIAMGFVGGYTGADWDDEYVLLREAVEGLGLAERVTIVNDSIAALRGGTAQPYGAILVAGSGANCAVRAPNGREYIYHYYHDSELQGGGALGRAALNAIYRAETGRPPQTSLRKRVLTHFKLPDVDALMRNLVEGMIPNDRVIEIAPFVFEEAGRGDAAAMKVVTHFGEGCAELLTNGLKRLGMVHLELEIVLSGGIFKAKSPLLRLILEGEVHRKVPEAVFVEARYEPVVGAALLALEVQGIKTNAALQANIERSVQALSLLRV
jgi:N-acetylglucosamine kinase-like BadF-type ATPase